MRALILIAAAALLASGCANNDQADNTQNVDENLTAENIISNDVTAIDAVTGQAANMAADVDMNFGNLDENAGNSASNEAAPKAREPAPKRSSPSAEGNSSSTAAANAATNAE
jgi:PBP1b-binding outer membrane lipoprotein LpoB